MTRVRRSSLCVPGSSRHMIERAVASDADVVICDLEDAVAPSARPDARTTVARAITDFDWQGSARAVRINALGSGGLRDLVEVVTAAGHLLDLVVVPKVDSPADVRAVAAALSELELEIGRVRPISIEGLIESAAGLSAAQEIARAHPRLEALTLGYGDLSASLGMRTDQLGEMPGYPGDGWHFARMTVVTAARSAGIVAVDGPVAQFRDLTAVRREAARAAALGMVGKWAIHPAQVQPCHEAFTPTESEYARARAVIEAVESGNRAGDGASAVEGSMIDAASIRMARTVVTTYERANQA